MCKYVVQGKLRGSRVKRMFKKIDIQGITHIEQVRGSSEWYYGTDYCHGDLYEAEEMFKNGHEIKSNKLLFIHYPTCEVFEPIKPKNGHYFGRPLYDDGIVISMVDFISSKINIVKLSEDFSSYKTIVAIELCEVEDCYNLSLESSPLMLIRQGDENKFEIIYPKKSSFDINNRDSLYFRDGDKLYFSTWYENPNYNEEVIVRDINTGEVLEKFPGIIQIMPDGQRWILQ